MHLVKYPSRTPTLSSLPSMARQEGEKSSKGRVGRRLRIKFDFACGQQFLDLWWQLEADLNLAEIESSLLLTITTNCFKHQHKFVIRNRSIPPRVALQSSDFSIVQQNITH